MVQETRERECVYVVITIRNLFVKFFSAVGKDENVSMFFSWDLFYLLSPFTDFFKSRCQSVNTFPPAFFVFLTRGLPLG